MIGIRSRIAGDLFDICNRIKQIDRSYFLVRNYKTKKFELHSDEQKGGSLCLVLPYDKLDARTLNLANKTRVENIHKIEQEHKAHNDMLIRQENAIFKERAMQRLEMSLYEKGVK